jgi:hypothetical protein
VFIRTVTLGNSSPFDESLGTPAPTAEAPGFFPNPAGSGGAAGTLTFGLYTLYWYYAINREMRDLGERVNPAMSLLAMTLGGFLVVPPIVSLYNTADRVRRTQERAGISGPISAVLTLILAFVPLMNIFVTTMLQSNLNQAYERLAGKPGSAGRGWSSPPPPAGGNR